MAGRGYSGIDELTIATISSAADSEEQKPENRDPGSGGGCVEGFCLRRYRPSDLRQLRALIHETINACYSGVYPPRAVQFFKEYHSENEITKRERDGTILVAERSGRLGATGSLLGREITGVFVAPSLQGCGLGRAVMRALEALAKAQDYEDVELSVSLPSRGFYEMLGYEILREGTIDVGQGQRLDFWTAKKTL
jgi:ribosomal protein S18 acetylase RimI-like enzyme